MISASTLIIRVLIIIVVLFLIDLYSFSALKTALLPIRSARLTAAITKGYWILTILFYIAFVTAIATFSRSKGITSPFNKLVFGGLILLYAPKLIICAVLLMEDAFRLISIFVGWIYRFITGAPVAETGYSNSRRQFISQFGIIIASIPFMAILYGMLKGKYNYTIHRAELAFKDLPDAFDGFTITQLSDIHSGSFDNAAEVARGIKLVNDQKSDLLLFTGDLVNNQATEMKPWMDLFKQLHAPMGKYSVLGNHDYGDYIQWDSPYAKQDNLIQLKKIHEQLGLNLLLNQHVKLAKGNDTISLLGVENWGTGGFAKYGDLQKTLDTVDPTSFKLLMSHDPSHWDAQVNNHPTHHIHLTLSGHTHGMQFGIEIPGIKWSPVQYRYPQWAGLYKKSDKLLYVNRGFGFLGFPGRVGIWPEITVITLRKAVS
jgi:uncharacterized protein